MSRIMLAALLSFTVLQMVALMSPGPDFFFVTRTAVAESQGRAMLGVLGITTGAGFWATISITGLHIIFERAAWLQGAMAAAGGAYLLWMGLSIIIPLARRRLGGAGGEKKKAGDASLPRRNAAHPYLFGLFTNLSNPKVLVFFTGVFSVFVTPGQGWAMRAALVAIVIVTTFAWFSFVAFVLGLSGPRRAYRALAGWIDAAAGFVFAGFGAGLLASAVRDAGA